MEFLIIYWNKDNLIQDIVCFTKEQAIRKDGSFTVAFTTALRAAFCHSDTYKITIEERN